MLCYAGTGQTHLAHAVDQRVTLCGRNVVDVPTVPRTVAPLSCPDCKRAWTNRARAEARA